MADSRPHAGTLGSLAQAYVGEQCAVILEARFAIASRDDSVVHPARVAIRRLRATLRTFHGVYDAGHAASFANDLRWAGLLLGDVRDLQVLAERFAETEVPAATAVEQVIADEIQRDRDKAWDAVTHALSSARGAALYAAVARWQNDPPYGDKAAHPAARAQRKVEKADTRLRKRLDRARAAAGEGDPAAADLLHTARKAGKRHRYVVELAAPVLGARAEETIAQGKALQDALGEHQDAVVALAFLQQIDLDAQQSETASALSALIARTRESAADVTGVLSAAARIRG